MADRRHRKGRFRRRRRKVKGSVELDLISSLPDVILQHILCFIPTTKFAITTSVLSKRWRHVWCDIPSLSFDANILKAASSLNETLTHYTAPKMMNFHLKTSRIHKAPHLDTWIKLAMSRNVENMSLDFDSYGSNKYSFPDSFYINSSVKQLTVMLHFASMIPRCSVSWTSLKNLFLRCCKLFDESMANILLGCPLLESLTLYFCDELEVLDLSKSLRLRTLEVNRNIGVRGPKQIVAPHIHCLRLRNSQLQCTLVDVASLTEAKLDICYVSIVRNFKADFLQDMVLKMLEKLQHVEKLTFGGNFLHVLSLAEIRGVPFPMLKVKVLILETVIFQYVIPGIERLLQNSPDLEKIIIRAIDCNTIPKTYLDKYLSSQGLNPNECWKSKDGVFWNIRWDVESKDVVSLVDLVLDNTKTTLDKMVVLLNERYLKFNFKKLLPTLSQHRKVFNALFKDTSNGW